MSKVRKHWLFVANHNIDVIAIVWIYFTNLFKYFATTS